MAEINSGFMNGTSALMVDEPFVMSPNLNEPLSLGTTIKAHLDAERGVFITSRNTEIELSGNAVSSLMLERITNAGKPKIPMVEVTLLGKHKQMQANPNEPGYLALLKEWENEQNVNMMRYVFNVGAKGQPPQEFIELQAPFFPDATSADFKYLWVSSKLPDEDINSFIETILGKSIATAKGVEQAADSFRS